MHFLWKKVARQRVKAFRISQPLAFLSFSLSFSCLFFQATASWKDLSSSVSEKSLGFTLKFLVVPFICMQACHCWPGMSQFTLG